ncbi:Protein PilI [Gammaproteobacteria bacterium]
MDHSDPFLLLHHIEARARARDRDLPRRVEGKQVWSGIVFRLGTEELVAPLIEISEVLAYPTVSRVPGVKAWVKGIANFRGNLLPIMDLRTLLEGIPVVQDRRNRVLVVSHKEIFAGLLVDEVIGLRHFQQEESSLRPPTINTAFAAYLQGGFERNGRFTPVFGFHALAESREFMEVAAT